MAWGWSEMVNFMAVTTVVLMRADGDDSAIFSLGSRLTGSYGQDWSLLSSTQGGSLWGAYKWHQKSPIYIACIQMQLLGFIITPKRNRLLLASAYILLLSQTAFEIRVAFLSYLVDHNPDPLNGMILFSGHFGGDGPGPLNRDITVFAP